ncbi:MAG: hypothetical protein EOP11_12120 [Proteobacteria bacterium]|nr:MAG: hypothetical protein EOP11_12120 [Pseudomonadota bacterium]
MNQLILNNLTNRVIFGTKQSMRNPFRLPITLSIVAFALTAASSFAGDGGGINGPNLSGKSIPAALDGGTTWGNVIQAFYGCMVSNKFDRDGSIPVLKRLTEELTNKKVDEPGSPYITQFYARRDLRDPRGEFNAGSFPRSECAEGTRDCMGKSPFNHALRFNLSVDGIFRLQISRPDKYNQAETFLRGVEPIVSVKWNKSEVICDGYDELGDCLNQREILLGVTIVKHFSNTVIPLINEQTNQPTPLSINGDEVLACINSKLADGSDGSQVTDKQRD